jgi:lipopolysaccharide transport system ATP-binding protein
MSLPTQNSGGEPRPRDADVLLRCERVSKKFCRSLKKSLWYGVKDIASELLPFSKKSVSKESGILEGNASQLRAQEFWAVNNVSFELKRGECLGLIGHNGAGKTTLLKMLNGLIKPDAGRIEMRGRVGALIALGAGFNPILTGRENVYVNGSVLGLSKKELDEKIDEIIEFSEIGESIDAPVQNYSSGMQVRLGFAVATAIQPDVLLLDEVLAVGDASFRHKCYSRINKIIKNCAVILVSHSMDSIAAVSSAVGFMDHGKFAYFPDPTDGIQAYNDAMTANTLQSCEDGGAVFAFYPPILGAKVNIHTPRVCYGEKFEASVELDLSEPMRSISFSFSAYNQNEQPVMNWNLSRADRRVDLEAGKNVFRFTIPSLHLHDGLYRWSLWIGQGNAIEANLYAMRAGEFVVTSSFKPISNIPYIPKPTEFSLERLDRQDS